VKLLAMGATCQNVLGAGYWLIRPAVGVRAEITMGDG